VDVAMEIEDVEEVRLIIEVMIHTIPVHPFAHTMNMKMKDELHAIPCNCMQVTMMPMAPMGAEDVVEYEEVAEEATETMVATNISYHVGIAEVLVILVRSVRVKLVISRTMTKPNMWMREMKMMMIMVMITHSW
jgi:hypothetical protein